MKFTKEEEKQIIDFYTIGGLNTVSISKKINRSQTGIERFLKRNNIFTKPRKNEIPQVYIDNIILLYINGLSSLEIYEKYKNILKSPDTILHILKQNNISRRSNARKSIIKNHSYFENIDTKEKAYFLGLIISDGSVIKPNGTRKQFSIRIELKSSDKYILEKFGQEIGFMSSLGESRGCHYITFCSDVMANDLLKLGVIPNKTYFGTFLPNLEDNLMPHLIRGIFDGDGTVYFDKNKNFNWGFYGSPKLCNEIQNFLSEKLCFKKNTVFNKATVSFIYLHSKERTLKFYNYIYQDPSVFLSRKKEKFDLYWQYRDNLLLKE